MGRKAKFPIGAEVFGAMVRGNRIEAESARVVGRDDKGRIVLDKALRAFGGVESVRRGLGFATAEEAIANTRARVEAKAQSLSDHAAYLRHVIAGDAGETRAMLIGEGATVEQIEAGLRKLVAPSL